MSASTFPAVIAALVHTDTSRPLVTFYDDATGERIELSVATYVNWVNKTAGLVRDELDIEPGALVLVDLPTHWLGPVWLGAGWTLGLCVTADRSLAEEADLVVCGPERVDAYADLADSRAVVALSLRPLGGRFLKPLPSGVTDYGAGVLAHPDDFVPYSAPAPEDPAWRDAAATWTQADLLSHAGEDSSIARGRLLTDVNPCTTEGMSRIVPQIVGRGSMIYVANPEEAGWRQRYDDERATHEIRRQPPRS